MYLRRLCCDVELKEARTKFLKNKPGTLLVCPKCQTYWRMCQVQGKIYFEKLPADEVEDSNNLREKNKQLRDYLVQNGWRPNNSINGIVWLHPAITPSAGPYDFDSALVFQSLLDQALAKLKIK